MNLVKCESCGGDIVDGKQKYHHIKKCVEFKKEGIDHIVCLECGYRAVSLSNHIKLHGMDSLSYREKYPEALLNAECLNKQRKGKLKGMVMVSPKDRKGAFKCQGCDEWFTMRNIAPHRRKCVTDNPERFKEGFDYVKCPQCDFTDTRIGSHLKNEHKWDKHRLQKAINDGLVLTAKSINDKKNKSIGDNGGFKKIAEKRKKTCLERYGTDNPFKVESVKKRIIETNLERYGEKHPMQTEEIRIKQNKSAGTGMSGQEKLFDKYTCDNVVFTGLGSRFIRAKKGVKKYGRIIKNLNPDFMIFKDCLVKPALALIEKGQKLNYHKFSSRYVIELLGDYYHSEDVIGTPNMEHVQEIKDAYASVGIKCMVIWERDIVRYWDTTQIHVEEWVKNAIEDTNSKPVHKRVSRAKEPFQDKRVARIECPLGSGKKFRSQKQLDKWLNLDNNYWKEGLEEDKDYVVCKLCEERHSKMGWHLKKEHNLSSKEYLAKFPDSKVTSDEAKRVMARANSNKTSKKYEQRTVYRCPDGSIIRKKDGWLRAWGTETPPGNTILNAEDVNLDKWSELKEGEDYVVCLECGYKARNIKRHVKREHSLETYKGELVCNKLRDTYLEAGRKTWLKRERKPKKEKIYKKHGLTKDLLHNLYIEQGLTDKQIGIKFGMTGEGIAYQRKKYGVIARKRAIT